MIVKKSRSVDDIVADLRRADAGNIEATLLKPHLVRELYKAIGEPTAEDFPEESKHSYEWSKVKGYTKDFCALNKKWMEWYNKTGTDWCIKRPSQVKLEIVEEYVREGWHCYVDKFVVTCDKFVKHPRYDGVWVHFNVTRNCARYEYTLEDTNSE